MAKEVICILAGNYSQALSYAEDKGLNKHEWIYTDCTNPQLSSKRFSEILCVGTFWQRDDAATMHQLAELRLVQEKKTTDNGDFMKELKALK